MNGENELNAAHPSTLPTIGKRSNRQLPKPETKEVELPPVELKIDEVTVRKIKIEVPMLEGLTLGYAAKRSDVVFTDSEAESMLQARLALERIEATLRDGTPVNSLSRVVRWFAQQIKG
jgi:hypothetical protein